MKQSMNKSEVSRISMCYVKATWGRQTLLNPLKGSFIYSNVINIKIFETFNFVFQSTFLICIVAMKTSLNMYSEK